MIFQVGSYFSLGCLFFFSKYLWQEKNLRSNNISGSFCKCSQEKWNLLLHEEDLT